MKTIWVSSSQSKYPVFVGDKLIRQAGKLIKQYGFNGQLPGKVMVVTQLPIARHHLSSLLKSLAGQGIKAFVHYLPDGEAAKSQAQLFKLYDALLKKDFERRDLLIALGGGVAGDLTGFTAATYLRGIGFVNIGTTLLAQVDSSLGGKTGINLPAGKNLIGAFYPPKLVISDSGVLTTLPDREYKASLAEVVKYGIIRHPQLFRLLESQFRRVLARDRKVLAAIVTVSARIKALVVSRDEFETKGERVILNYGHTFGHGFEKATGYRKLLHGEAVSLGMVCAANLAVRMKLLNPESESRQEQLLRKLGLPVKLGSLKLSVKQVLGSMRHDKKKQSGKLRYVLPDRIGHVVVRKDVQDEMLREVLNSIGCRG